jgi:hypothetical protein
MPNQKNVKQGSKGKNPFVDYQTWGFTTFSTEIAFTLSYPFSRKQVFDETMKSIVHPFKQTEEKITCSFTHNEIYSNISQTSET